METKKSTKILWIIKVTFTWQDVYVKVYKCNRIKTEHATVKQKTTSYLSHGNEGIYTTWRRVTCLTGRSITKQQYDHTHQPANKLSTHQQICYRPVSSIISNIRQISRLFLLESLQTIHSHSSRIIDKKEKPFDGLRAQKPCHRCEMVMLLLFIVSK